MKRTLLAASVAVLLFAGFAEVLYAAPDLRREELLGQLQELGRRLGRVPTAKDVDANRGWMPSKSLYWHTFGSLSSALAEAGFDVAVGAERLERLAAIAATG